MSYRLSSQLSTANKIPSLDFHPFAPIIDQRREINELRRNWLVYVGLLKGPVVTISAAFAVAIFLYITVILNEEFLRKIFTMNQTGPGVEKCRLDDLLSELGISSEQFSTLSSRIWEKCARNIRSDTELIHFFRGKSQRTTDRAAKLLLGL